MALVLVAAALLPWVFNLLHNFEVGWFAIIDLTPFAFIVTGAVLVWGLFRERLIRLIAAGPRGDRGEHERRCLRPRRLRPGDRREPRRHGACSQTTRPQLVGLDLADVLAESPHGEHDGCPVTGRSPLDVAHRPASACPTTPSRSGPTRYGATPAGPPWPRRRRAGDPARRHRTYPGRGRRWRTSWSSAPGSRLRCSGASVPARAACRSPARRSPVATSRRGTVTRSAVTSSTSSRSMITCGGWCWATSAARAPRPRR